MANADVIFNIARGTIKEKIADGATLGVLLLKAAGLEDDSTLVDYDTVSALLAGTSDECDFTNYARKSIANGSCTVTVDDTTNASKVVIPNQTWTNAGGATNNSIGKLVIFEDVGGADSSRVPLCAYVFLVTTDGTSLTAQAPTDGFWSSP